MIEFPQTSLRRDIGRLFLICQWTTLRVLKTNLHMPKPNQFSQNAMRTEGKVHVCSGAKFKGLKADIIFLWDLDGINPDNQEDRMDLHVGCSRPRNELRLVGGRRLLQRITGEI